MAADRWLWLFQACKKAFDHRVEAGDAGDVNSFSDTQALETFYHFGPEMYVFTHLGVRKKYTHPHAFFGLNTALIQ